MKCNKCDKAAEYVTDGESVCKDHKGNKGKQEEQTSEETAGDRMVG